MPQDFDLTVIGGGPAGLSASIISALFGAKTALIEADKLGGECTWSGCVPSKTLLRTAKLIHQIRTAETYGLTSRLEPLNFQTVMARVHSVQHNIYEEADAPPNLAQYGIETISGFAKFVNQNEVEVSNGNVSRRVTSRYFVIASGSRPNIPPIEGISEVQYLTNQTIFKIDWLPQRMIVVGAGPVGMEMAQAFNRLGSKVIVITSADSVLPNDDRELTGILCDKLKEEGIKFLFSAGVTKVERIHGGVKAMTSIGTEEFGDAILLATGRKSNADNLNLRGIGVSLGANGIIVNRRCQTSVKNIYAAGDVTGKFNFTHMAEHMGKIAVFNALLHLPYTVDERGVTWCTYTDPELAHVGASEKMLISKGIRFRVYRFPFHKIDRAITDNAQVGEIKVLANRTSGRIYGATILGANAGEMIGEFNLAIRNKISLGKMSATIHPYPTFALGNRRVADQWYVQNQTPNLTRWIQRIFGYRGVPPPYDRSRIV